MKKIKFIDLFCGLGGFHLAFKNHICVLASDIDKHAEQIYLHNFPNTNFVSDITQIKANHIPKHDLIVAGFPCQPFSSAGKGMGFHDPRGTLFYDILRIAKYHKPKVLFLENISRLVNHDKGNTFKTIKQSLEKEGYFVNYKVLNAKDFGLAQNRERTIIVASKEKKFNFNFLKKIDYPSLKIKDILVPNSNDIFLKESEYTIIDKNLWKEQKSGLIFCGYRNKNQRKNGVKENTQHLSRVHKQPNRIYHINGTHPTLSASEVSGRYFVYDGKRVKKLNIKELYRLQGFPSNYKLIGSKSELIKRVGNSVPINMIQKVSNEIIRQLF